MPKPWGISDFSHKKNTSIHLFGKGSDQRCIETPLATLYFQNIYITIYHSRKTTVMKKQGKYFYDGGGGGVSPQHGNCIKGVAASEDWEPLALTKMQRWLLRYQTLWLNHWVQGGNQNTYFWVSLSYFTTFGSEPGNSHDFPVFF